MPSPWELLRRLWFIAAVSVLSTALTLWVPFVSKSLVDEALIGRNSSALVRAVALFIALTVFGYLLNIWSGLRYTRVSAEILFEMRLRLYRHLLSLSPRFWARTRLGDVVSRLNNDISEIQRVTAETVLSSISNVLFLVGSVAMMTWLDPRMLLLSLATLPAGLWTLYRYRGAMEGRASEVRQASAGIGTFLIETLTGVRQVTVSNAQQREADRFRARNDGFIAALLRLQWTSYFAGGLPALILSLGTALVFLYGGKLVIEGTITIGTLVAFLAYHMRLMSPVQALMALWTNWAMVRVSLRRVEELFAEAPEVVESSTAIAVEAPRGDVEFREVSLSYDRGSTLIENVSFHIAAGEAVAIMGPSGSGKSTIADLMVRLLDPDSGAVFFDGMDLRHLRLVDLRRSIALVEQDPFLFHCSIAENLRYGNPDATLQEMEQACRAASIHEFIRALPEGYETTVGERGLALSKGEKQRIAIARGYLARPSILVLDEPTSALDPDTERVVIDGYLKAGCTVIVITHRAEVARRAHRTLVVDRNQVQPV